MQFKLFIWIYVVCDLRLYRLEHFLSLFYLRYEKKSNDRSNNDNHTCMKPLIQCYTFFSYFHQNRRSKVHFLNNNKKDNT